MRATTVATASRAPDAARPRGASFFLLRWVTAVGLALVTASSIEYALATGQLEERSLAEAAKAYEADLHGLVGALSEAPPAVRGDAVRQELERVAATYGTRNVLLFTADGRLVMAARAEPDEDKAVEVRSVVATGRAVWEKEDDDGEAEETHRYEFLLPVRTADGRDFVVEVDQRADIIEDLLADLRLRKAYGLLLGLLVALPLSYLLGGRTLNRRHASAERAADTDALTGLAGRRPFRPALQAALDDPAVDEVVLALIDIDDFKGVNDRHGHSYGDRVLCAVAGSFDVLRVTDTAFRMGGDEFAVVLPRSSEELAGTAIERVREALAQSAPGIAFSCGLAAATAADALSLQELWERADAALYDAKHRGRRQTVAFSTMSDRLSRGTGDGEALHALLEDDAGLSAAP